MSAAARGDTVIIPAGSATWTREILLTQGITLHGAGIDQNDNHMQHCHRLRSYRTRRRLLMRKSSRLQASRSTGIILKLNNATMIDAYGATSLATKPWRSLIITNCKFRNGSTRGAVIFTHRQLRGVIYSNIFDRCNVILKPMGNNDSGEEWRNPAFTRIFGTSDQLFFEDNTILWSSPFNGSISGWIETGQGGRLCVRYNTWNCANTNVTELWDIHGFQNWPGNGQTGTMVVEYYGNRATNFTGWRWLNHRGGWGLFHNNIVSGPGGAGIQVNQYATGDIGGSGEDRVTGIKGGEINNTYVFNNTDDGVVRDMYPGGIGLGGNVAPNVAYWNYHPSFDGTTGIGRGTTAPTGNCSVGVAYWVASTPTPTTDPSVIQSGKLYKCLSQNVWTAYYTPYTYPHPLRSGGSTSQAATFTGGGSASTSVNGAGSSASVGGAGQTTQQVGKAFDSTQGVLSGPFTVNPDHTISQAVETTDPSQGGEARYLVQVTTAGDYAVDATVYAPNDGANSLFVNFDTVPTSPDMIWDIPANNGLTNNVVTWRGSGGDTQVWSLSAGVHTLILRGREAGTKVGQITIVNRSKAPAGGGSANASVGGAGQTTQQVGQAFDSTQGVVSAPFTVNPDHTISQAVETTDPSQGGEARYLVQVTTAGDYAVDATVYAPSDGANSLFVNFNTVPTSPDMIWDIPVNNGLTKNVVTRRGSGGEPRSGRSALACIPSFSAAARQG